MQEDAAPRDPTPTPEDEPPAQRQRTAGHDNAAAAKIFVDGIIMRDTVHGDCVLRFPSASNAERLDTDGVSLFALYAAITCNPVTPSVFANLMRLHKGHAGACRSGCGCLLNGNYCLKSIAIKSDHAIIVGVLNAMDACGALLPGKSISTTTDELRQGK